MRISDWSSDVCFSDLPFRRTGIKPVVNAVTQRLGELDPGLGKFGEHCFSYSAAAVAAGEGNWRNCASSRSMMEGRDPFSSARARALVEKDCPSVSSSIGVQMAHAIAEGRSGTDT